MDLQLVWCYQVNSHAVYKKINKSINQSIKPHEWMKHLYSALLCIAVHPKCFTIMWGGVSPQPPPLCSIHLDDMTAATAQRRQCAHHTPATGGEERVIEPIKWMGIIRRPWLTRASGGNLARTPGKHSYMVILVKRVDHRGHAWLKE